MNKLRCARHVISQWWLLLAVLIPLPCWSDTPSHIILLLDTGITGSNPALFQTIEKTLANRSEGADPMLGIVVFNTVVTYASEIKPLQDYGKLSSLLTRLAPPDLASPRQRTSNFAVGIERGLALLKGLPASASPAFLLASDGRIATGDATQDSQYSQWLEQVLTQRLIEQHVKLLPLLPQAANNLDSPLGKLSSVQGIEWLKSSASPSPEAIPKASVTRTDTGQAAPLQVLKSLPLPYRALIIAVAVLLLLAFFYWLYQRKSRLAATETELENALQPTRVVKLQTEDPPDASEQPRSAPTVTRPVDTNATIINPQQVTQERPSLQQGSQSKPAPDTPRDPDETQIRPAAK